MIETHVLLVLGWMVFGFLHSLLASGFVKDRLVPTFGTYYRLMYSLFALLSLSALLYYQFSISSVLLFAPQYWLLAISLISMILMGISMRTYFKFLSGVDVLTKTKVTSELQVTGMHAYTRHPLYLSTLLFAWSLAGVLPYLSHLLGVLIMTIYTVYGAQLEEKKLHVQYGQKYANYSREVPMFIPWKWLASFIFSGTSNKQVREHR